MEQRKALEAEIEQIAARLNAPGQPGARGSLVDKEVRATALACLQATRCGHSLPGAFHASPHACMRHEMRHALALRPACTEKNAAARSKMQQHSKFRPRTAACAAPQRKHPLPNTPHPTLPRPVGCTQGYPRADIDVHAVRTDRQRLICLSNDHKQLTSRIEQQLYALHAAARWALGG